MDASKESGPASLLEGYLLVSLCLLGALSPLAHDRPLYGALAFTGCACALFLNRFFSVPEAETTAPLEKIPPFQPLNLLAFLVVLSPILYYFTLTAFEEFPFRGDHNHHLWAILSARAFWPRNWVLPAIALSVWAVRRKNAAFPSLVLIAVWAFVQVPGDFIIYSSRYSSVLYTLALPLHFALTSIVHYAPLFASRLMNVSAFLAWLFVLRPWLLRKWPDPSLLLFGIFMMWQCASIHFLSSAYLEAWPVVFLMLSIELLLSNVKSRWLPCLLTACACLIKDQAILAFPAIWLACYWPELKLGKLKEAVRVGIILLAPVGVYFTLRFAVGVERFFIPSDPALIFSVKRGHEWLMRLALGFGPSGLIALAFVTFVQIAACSSSKVSPRYRLHRLMTLAGVALVVIYYVDHESAAWTGYQRYHLMAIPFLTTGLLELGAQLQQKRKKNWIVGLALGLMLLLAPSALRLLSLTHQPDSARNFIEHYEAPIYLPFRELVSQAEHEQMLVLGDSIFIQTLVPLHFLSAMPQGYPDIFEHYHFSSIRQGLNADPMNCECDPANPIVMALLVQQGHILKSNLYVEDALKIHQQCYQQMLKSCSKLTVLSLPDGRLAGIFGRLQ